MRLQAHAIDGNLRLLQPVKQMEECRAASLLIRSIKLQVVFVVEQQRSRIRGPRLAKGSLKVFGAQRAQQRTFHAQAVCGILARIDGFIDHIP